jgi:thiol:disulfide interchange protein DsbD
MRLLVAFFLLFPLFAHAVEEGELLEPEKAFALSAKVLDAHTLQATFTAAPGYYMYHDKFKFELDPKDVTLGKPQIPAGQIKQDEYFGKVEIFHGAVDIKLPISRVGTAVQTITLKATAQGCAEAGVCYSPVTQTAKLNLPAAPAASSSAGNALSALKSLGDDLGGGSDLLPPDQAFKVAAKVKSANTIAVEFVPAATYYLYRDKFKFKLIDAKGVAIDQVKMPKGEEKTDPTFGKTEVYHHPLTAEILLKRDSAAAQKVVLEASYQGCTEKGVCYLPMTKRFDLMLPAGGTVAAATNAAPVAESPAARVEAPQAAPETAAPPAAVVKQAPEGSATAPASEDEESRILHVLKTGSIWIIVGFFFVIGLGLSLTPCVFPMIPILSGIIAGQGHSITKSKGLVLSAAYVLGMAITYTIAGVVAGKSGALISAALQNAWVLGTFALLFVALSFSMFGFYELQMPTFIQSRLTETSNKMQGGHLAGVFTMGALSALIVGPCVAAPLAGTLLFIGQTGDAWKGGWALFSMSLGMGAPLIAVGVGGGSLLPRAGGWMNAVKSFFGVLLLGVAIWLISPVIPGVAQMLLWAALLIVSAIYLHALDPLPTNASGFKKFWKGVGVISLVVGVSLAIGALSGSRDILQPLAGLRLSSAGAAAAAAAPEQGLKFDRIKSADFEKRLQAAKGKPVMVDFYADWCVSCKELERFTFSDPKVQARLKDVALIQIDVTENSDADKAILRRFDLFGPPGLVFFGADGSQQKTRIIGYQPPEMFLKTLDTVLK